MSNASYEKAKASIDKSLHKLKTDYLDLMLIHQPFGDYYGAYRAMEEAYKEGKLRAIGVSNFYPDRLIDLCQFAEIAPMVNQVETHVFQQQRTAHEYMKKYGVQHEAWGPFAEGKKNCFTNPVLAEIGEKYGKTAAQTALRFLIQSDVVVIPKSTHKERMEQNLDVFDFSLSETDTFWIGNKPISGCIACHKCNDRNRCAFEDTVNDFLSLAEDYDGFVFGTPVHWAGATGAITSFLDRAFYADLNGGGRRFYLKPAAAIMSARRAGTTATWDQLNKYFGLMQMPIITSRYWNMVHGTTPQEVMQDREGLATLRTLGHNMAYFLKCKEVGSKLVPLPPEEPWEMTNFIR